MGFRKNARTKVQGSFSSAKCFFLQRQNYENGSPVWRMKQLYRNSDGLWQLKAARFWGAFEARNTGGRWKIKAAHGRAKPKPSSSTMSMNTKYFSFTDQELAPPGVIPKGSATEINSGELSSSFQSAQASQASAGQGLPAANELVDDQESNESSKFRLPFGPPPLGQAAPRKSFRIHIGIKSSDNGFERIHHDLGCMADDGRGQHIKRLLIATSLGIGIARWPALVAPPSLVKNQSTSFNVKFRLSSRDGGLEALNAELCRMPIAAQRNQFIKRLLFNAYIAAPKQPQAAQPVVHAPQALPPAVAFGSLAECATWSAAPATLASADADADARSEEKRAFKRKNSVDSLSSAAGSRS